MNHADDSRAYADGQAARRNGTKREHNPFRFRRDQDGAYLAERWHDGYDDQDATLRGREVHAD